ncbi:hypothetical protein O2W18_10970 [Modestobacter sp. VKM Ac-2983]|nr:hypothetical protein [Modestobacter sp. VKM Ac-2983]MCZ2805627.1 hypothetical protein [Modestobacter sp. VKM Ac-2983]
MVATAAGNFSRETTCSIAVHACATETSSPFSVAGPPHPMISAG